MYNYAKLTHPEWAVDYISPAVCAEVCLSYSKQDKANLSTENEFKLPFCLSP